MQGKKKVKFIHRTESIQTESEWAKSLNLTDKKHLKAAIVSMLEELKETRYKEVKENRVKMTKK